MFEERLVYPLKISLSICIMHMLDRYNKPGIFIEVVNKEVFSIYHIIKFPAGFFYLRQTNIIYLFCKIFELYLSMVLFVIVPHEKSSSLRFR